MAKPENLTCPDCGAAMVSRVNKQTQQRFWGCERYPQCRGTRDTDGRSRQERGPRDAPPQHRDEDGLPSQRWTGRDRRRWD